MTDQSANMSQLPGINAKKAEENRKTVSFKCSVGDLMAIDAAAKEMGMTRSSWLAAVIREALQKSCQ